MRNGPLVAFRGRDGKQVSPSVPKDDASTKRHSYTLRSRVENPDKKESDLFVGKFSFISCNMSFFYVGEYCLYMGYKSLNLLLVHDVYDFG